MIVYNILDCIGNTPLVNLKLFGRPTFSPRPST